MPHGGDGTEATPGKASNGRSRALLLPRPRWAAHTEGSLRAATGARVGGAGSPKQQAATPAHQHIAAHREFVGVG